MKKLALSVASCLVIAACSSSQSTSSSQTPAGGGDGGGGTQTTTDPPGSFSVSFPSVTVAPSTEKTQCVTLRLHNPNPIHVGTIHNVLAAASHHMIVYRVKDTVERTTPYDCQPFTDTLDPTKGGPLMITQKKDETLKLPAGVGFTLDADQMMRLEVHYLNAGDKPQTLTATSTLTALADADFKDEGDFIFIGNPDIKLPANKQTTLGPSFFKMPAEYADAKFFAITGHEHHLGTNVRVWSAANANDQGTPVYDVPNWSWSEPETVYHDPTFSVPAGGGFRFTCDWNNTTNQSVSFGESATAEMCFFWAYYYPSKGSRVCFHTTQAGGGAGIDQCCPGSQLCSFF